jgi:hypothetical protein
MTRSTLEDVILAELAASPQGRSISPEAVARAFAGEDWRKALPQVRAAAVGLARQGRVAILRHGKPADPDSFKGVYRLGRMDEG